MNLPGEGALADGLRKTAYADALQTWVGEDAPDDDRKLTYHAYQAFVEFLKEPFFVPSTPGSMTTWKAMTETERHGLFVFKEAGKCTDCHFLHHTVERNPCSATTATTTSAFHRKATKIQGLVAIQVILKSSVNTIRPRFVMWL